jgi:hypothetical protein
MSEDFKAMEVQADLNRTRDLDLMKIPDKSLKVMFGVTVKSIVENEAEGILEMAYTLTVKLLEDKHGDLSLNINKTGDEVPKYRNRRYNQSGVIEGYTGTSELISCSCHMNSTVKISSEIDFCPFTVSTYDLSIKLNSLNEDSEKHKVKTVFVSRYLDDFIQFQPGSIGRGISRGDFISVVGVSKLKKSAGGKELPKIGRTKHEGLWIDLDDANYETDEVVFRFVTRRNQISNLVGIVLPCILVPLIFGEISRRGGIETDSLLTGVLTLIFAMPPQFGPGTALWFSFAFSLCILAYVVNDPLFGMVVEALAVGFGAVFLLVAFYLQNRSIVTNNEGGRRLVDLVKDKTDEWRKLSLGELLCLV